MTLPLSGVTVVSFEQAVAAPFCSRHLGDLGARVIKVEQRAGGDFTRHYDDAVRGMASHFVWLNRNKESLTLDVKHPGAQQVLERLLARADVVMQNLAPGAAHRMGIGASDIVARFPRAIAVDISGYGTGGPYDEKRAYDLLIQAEGGVCSITGVPGSPAKAGPPVVDIGSGLYSLSGILAALYARERTGQGAAIQISMFDVVAEFMGFALQFTRHTGEERQPNGMSTPMVAPYGAYPTSDGQTVVLGTTNDREWQRLATSMLDRPDLAADPRFATNMARCEERAVLDEVIGEWTRRHPLATDPGGRRRRRDRERALQHGEGRPGPPSAPGPPPLARCRLARRLASHLGARRGLRRLAAAARCHPRVGRAHGCHPGRAGLLFG